MAGFSLNGPVRALREILRLRSSCGVPQTAGALAYFLLLTVFPLLLCINYLIGLLRLDLGAVLGPAEQLLPEQVGRLLEAYLDDISQNRSPAVFAAGLGSILVSASAGVRGVLDTLNRLYGCEGKKGMKRVVVSVALSGMSLLAVYGSAAVLLTGSRLLKVLELVLPRKIGALTNVWAVVRYGLLLGLMLLLVLSMYWAGSPPRLRDRTLMGTAVACAVVMAVCSGVFSWFAGVSVRYSLVYGSLASLIILLVWLYLCGNILLTGAVVGWVLRGN